MRQAHVELTLALGSGGAAAAFADLTLPPTQRGTQVNSVKCLSVPLPTSSTHIDDPRGGSGFNQVIYDTSHLADIFIWSHHGGEIVWPR